MRLALAFKRVVQTSLVVGCSILLMSCESPEERLARETQFDGRSISEVVARIGKPDKRTNTQAIWSFETSTRRQVPIILPINGIPTLMGYRQETVYLNCTYTATLSSGVIKSSHYEGTSCAEYAPKLPQ